MQASPRFPEACKAATNSLKNTLPNPPPGDTEARDVCAHLVWVLVKDDRKLLSPAKGALGVDAVKLVEPLMDLVEQVGAVSAFLLSCKVCCVHVHTRVVGMG